MASGPTLADARAAAMAMLAAECGCAPLDFEEEGLLVVQRPPELSRIGLARRYPPCAPGLALISFGSSTIVSASASIQAAVESIFAGADRDDAFAPDRLGAANALLAPHRVRAFWPSPRFLCGVDTLRDPPTPIGVRIALELDPGEARIASILPSRWPHAFSPRRKPPLRPTRAIGIAYDGGELVGVAAASEDSPRFWQIGIDVAPEARGRGISPALVAPIARAALELGFLPFYSVGAANIRSIRTALSAGFLPSWLEVFSVALPPR